ncbi:MAG: hypothetical protein E5X04_02625, partial [Mesorhizobium sp.]
MNRGGEGNLITVMMMPDGKAWRFADISPDKARPIDDPINVAVLLRLSQRNNTDRNMSVQPIKAFALVDDDNGISLSHLFTACQRSVWQKELDDLAAKLAQKGATHTMRIVEVIVAPAND